ncbi:hypothetical protein A6E92_19665 [Streptomyces sp. S8]|uniref:MYXO-CTERM sorting domain-containing protein n=1 Tax=Streptomyces sp. S8 TaxID=1837283 RepID=UPI000A0936FE|nr:MYXO-CTERM sorting domain-containing protein [Streptomyces sp. S8]ARI54145.1 hypothetical protein A6E92_19665 [Streptomyces sp. S8]
MTEKSEEDRRNTGARDSLSLRTACSLLPFEPNGERIPVSYMEHRLGLSLFIIGPGGLFVGALAALDAQWWFAVFCGAAGLGATIVSVLMVLGLMELRTRRHGRAS